MVGWLLTLSDRISVYIAVRLPETGRKREKRESRTKMSKQPPAASTASTVGSCPITSLPSTKVRWFSSFLFNIIMIRNDITIQITCLGGLFENRQTNIMMNERDTLCFC